MMLQNFVKWLKPACSSNNATIFTSKLGHPPSSSMLTMRRANLKQIFKCLSILSIYSLETNLRNSQLSFLLFHHLPPVRRVVRARFRWWHVAFRPIARKATQDNLFRRVSDVSRFSGVCSSRCVCTPLYRPDGLAWGLPEGRKINVTTTGRCNQDRGVLENLSRLRWSNWLGS